MKPRLSEKARELRGRKRGRRALRAIGKAVREQREHAAVATFGEMRRSFRDGDLLLFRGHGVISSLIRAITRSPYSHAGLVYTFEGCIYCIEAVGAGVRIILLSELIQRYHGGIDYFEVEASLQERRRAVSFCFKQLGKFYDKPGLFRFAASLIFDRRAVSERDERWFCSELVAASYEAQGLPLTAQQDAYTSPSDLAMSPRVKLVCRLKEAEAPEVDEAPELALYAEGGDPSGVESKRARIDHL
jgi:hypothetical protein